MPVIASPFCRVALNTARNWQAELGNVDVLIYNAGSGSWQTVDEITPDDFERSWRVTAG
jgi:NAD(P)-dependent dehydrogenase (short-subunit alcohol dehydrogenase family)